MLYGYRTVQLAYRILAPGICNPCDKLFEGLRQDSNGSYTYSCPFQSGLFEEISEVMEPGSCLKWHAAVNERCSRVDVKLQGSMWHRQMFQGNKKFCRLVVKIRREGRVVFGNSSSSVSRLALSWLNRAGSCTACGSDRSGSTCHSICLHP